LADFATKLSAESQEFSLRDIQSLRQHGFTEKETLDAIVAVSLADFFSVLQAGLGAAPDFARRWKAPLNESKIGARKAHLSAPDSRHINEASLGDPDGECVDRVRSGNLDSFEELMNRHSQRIYRTLMGILGNPEEARDAMQDTFLKAFQNINGFERRSKFSTWLVTIATNTGIQRLRERKPHESLDEATVEDEGFRPKQLQAWTDDPEQLYSQTEMRSLIENGVMKLPSKYRVVLMLRDIEQLPIEEAAAALGLGIPAIKSRLLRGRLMLREALAPHFISSEPKGSAKGVTS
jgi:RNA polymerase sigma-70 factor (ECF subfamily)